MGFDNNNKDLTAANAGRADICNLMHGTSGQGQKTKGKITPEYQWDVSSPDLDPAEYAVGGLCDKTQISAGFYNHAELKENTKKRWKNYAQARFDGPVGSMPNWVKNNIWREGFFS